MISRYSVANGLHPNAVQGRSPTRRQVEAPYAETLIVGDNPVERILPNPGFAASCYRRVQGENPQTAFRIFDDRVGNDALAWDDAEVCGAAPQHVHIGRSMAGLGTSRRHLWCERRSQVQRYPDRMPVAGGKLHEKAIGMADEMACNTRARTQYGARRRNSLPPAIPICEHVRVSYERGRCPGCAVAATPRRS